MGVNPVCIVREHVLGILAVHLLNATDDAIVRTVAVSFEAEGHGLHRNGRTASVPQMEIVSACAIQGFSRHDVKKEYPGSVWNGCGTSITHTDGSSCARVYHGSQKKVSNDTGYCSIL